jgi:hypothetical protein
MHIAGYVYIAFDRLDMAYKIGAARNVPERMKRLNGAITRITPVIVDVCGIATSDPLGLERALHRLFKAQRITGEWYQLWEDDLEFLDRLAGDGVFCPVTEYQFGYIPHTARRGAQCSGLFAGVKPGMKRKG